VNTQKIAITIPSDLLTSIDKISKKKGFSRSRFISEVLREKIRNENKKEIKEAYDRVFSDEATRDEQLQTALWFEAAGSGEGQEW